MLLHVFVEYLCIYATRSADSDQRASPSTERIPIPEHRVASPLTPEVDHPMTTTTVEETTHVVAPEVGTSGATLEPWMNHVSALFA